MVQNMASFDVSRLRAALFALFLLAASASRATSAQDDYNPLTPPDTSRPRATLHSFIDGCNDRYDVIQAREHLNRRDQKYGSLADYILDCLDQSELPEYARADLARSWNADGWEFDA